MQFVTVKIVRDNKEEKSENILCPITAAEAKSALAEIEEEWKGRLTTIDSDLIIAGQSFLTPGSTYYLHLKSKAARPDPSALVSRLMSNGPSDLPGLNELRGLLARPLPIKLPISEEALRMLSPEIADQFTVGGSQLSTYVSSAVITSPRGRGEIVTASHVDVLVIRILQALDDLQPLEQRLDLELQRDQGDSTSQMTARAALGRSLRPDLMLREASTGRLLLKGEDKDSEHYLQDAIADLTGKMARWSDLYYGTLDYLLSYAAGGDRLQFVALHRGNPAVALPISPIYVITNPDQRAAVVLAAFNLYTLLAAVIRSLPEYVLPAGKKFSEEHRAGFTRTLYFCPDQPRAIKEINPWTRFSQTFSLNQEWLTSVYQLTAQRAGLIHAVEAPTFDVTYHVELEPLGLAGGEATVTSEAELLHAAHGLLHGLDAMHSVSFVHRDMRWPNTSCDVTRTHYFLLDLELAAPADLECPFNLKGWTANTLVQGRYTTSSDLHMLGQMLKKHESKITHAAGRQFVTSLARPAEQLARDNVTAASLLQHEWLSCVGEHCRQAGAQPNTH